LINLIIYILYQESWKISRDAFKKLKKNYK